MSTNRQIDRTIKDIGSKVPKQTLATPKRRGKEGTRTKGRQPRTNNPSTNKGNRALEETFTTSPQETENKKTGDWKQRRVYKRRTTTTLDPADTVGRQRASHERGDQTLQQIRQN